MSRKRKPRHAPGDVWYSEEFGGYVRMTEDGGEEEVVTPPYDPDFEGAPDSLDHIPRRADGSIAPFHSLDHDQLESLGQETARTPVPHRIRHDGWTLTRQTQFIERLAATASVTDAARYVGMSRQSARDLYNRSPQFRAAWDEALRAAVSVLAETAFDRAVNGVQEQVWYQGRMVGFREKYNDRLLMFLLRVRDPLNYAPLDDLTGWQRHRSLEDRGAGIAPVLDRLEAAERAWAAAQAEPPALPAPADRLVPSLESPREAGKPAALPGPQGRRRAPKTPHT